MNTHEIEKAFNSYMDQTQSKNSDLLLGEIYFTFVQ